MAGLLYMATCSRLMPKMNAYTFTGSLHSLTARWEAPPGLSQTGHDDCLHYQHIFHSPEPRTMPNGSVDTH